MEDTEEGNEGMSTGKKVAAGAAIGVAVPAAVAVGKKLLGSDDEGEKQQRSGGRSASPRTKARARGTTKRASTSRSRTRSSSSTSRSSGASRASGRTKEQLYSQAKRLGIEGRSSMTKAQLERAISRKRT